MRPFLCILCATMMFGLPMSVNAAALEGLKPYEPMSIGSRSAQIRSEADKFVRQRLAGHLIDDVEATPPSAIDEASIDQIVDLLNDDSDAVRGKVAMAIAAIGPRARRATPALEHALELARQYITFAVARNLIFSGFPIYTGPSSADDICHALREIGAPEPPDCFNGYYDPVVETQPATDTAPGTSP
jgi:hypothetical protein